MNSSNWKFVSVSTKTYHDKNTGGTFAIIEVEGEMFIQLVSDGKYWVIEAYNMTRPDIAPSPMFETGIAFPSLTLAEKVVRHYVFDDRERVYLLNNLRDTRVKLWKARTGGSW